MDSKKQRVEMEEISRLIAESKERQRRISEKLNSIQTKLGKPVMQTVLGGKTYTISVTPYFEEHYDEIIAKQAEDLARIQAENRRDENIRALLYELANSGMKCEKGGDPVAAIDYYEQALSYAAEYPDVLKFHNYAHVMERLIVLYRKRKNYDQEIALCERYIQETPRPVERNKYAQRLEKAKALKQKSML